MSEVIGSIGFSPTSRLGLNNQKLALLGLLMRGLDEHRPVVLPPLALFDSSKSEWPAVPFGDVFNYELMCHFARRFGIEITDGEPTTDVEGWPCFTLGAWLSSQDAPRGLAVIDGFVCQFFNHLVPCITSTTQFKSLLHSVFVDHGIQTVVQLRIEKDWVAYSRDSLTSSHHGIEEGEEYLPSFETILKKVQNTWELPSTSVYVACDEANLPVSKEYIRKEVLSRFGLKLIWKSDVVPATALADMTILDLSLLDFEMAVRAPYFVGLSRSTFSDLAGFERVCRTRRNLENHYIYNVPGDGLGRRMDNGSQILPKRVLNRLLRRDSLIERSADDYRWPATLTAHISNFGNLTSDSCLIIGAQANPLVCGVRGSFLELIEGFVLHLAHSAPMKVEYRALLDDETWTPWTQDGLFVGTEGQSRALCGFSVRLIGDQALSAECLCIGSFVGHPDVIVVGSGEDCCSGDGAKLEAMQIAFRPAYHKWRDMDSAYAEQPALIAAA